MAEFKLTVIAPISRAEQVRLMGGPQGPSTRSQRAGLAIARDQSQHADGSKRRRRKSKRERDAMHVREDKHYAFMAKDGTRKRPRVI